MKLSRRRFLAALGGFVAGGALPTSAGLGYYYGRRRRTRAVKVKLTREDNWILTEADREAIAAGDKLVNSDMLEILDNIDIPGGGDYRSTRVSGLGDCVEACEADTQCKAFTFARSNHPLPRKRQMCWLKAETPNRTVSSISYVSGRRLGN